MLPVVRERLPGPEPGDDVQALVQQLGPDRAVRLLAGSVGVHHVFVNGIETVRDGQPTGATPGTVLRSGRETDTVTAR